MKGFLIAEALLLAATASADDPKQTCATYAGAVQTVAMMRDKGAPMDRVMAMAEADSSKKIVARIYQLGWRSPQELAGDAYLECLEIMGEQI